jgi:hypothetical protein
MRICWEDAPYTLHLYAPSLDERSQGVGERLHAMEAREVIHIHDIKVLAVAVG